MRSRPPHTAGPWRSGRAWRGWGALLPAGVALIVAAGCSTRDDPTYNRYCPANGDPTVLELGEGAMDLAGDALDNLDERLDNVID